MILATQQPFGDVLARTVRTRSMGLRAELLWAFMPPRTIGTAAVTPAPSWNPRTTSAGTRTTTAWRETYGI
ncbi:hypothetical protein ACFWVF_24435 [Streptomyces sp. NPDC058659]|uniref:hypothetical protein n=1 Tax=unclassified Streptomyces TaxID=2593676 RepID=UPI0036526290